MRQRAQTTIEFTFAMIVFLFLAYGLVKVMKWAGTDLAERRMEHESSLTNSSNPDVQLNPNFTRTRHMDAFYKGNIAR